MSFSGSGSRGGRKLPRLHAVTDDAVLRRDGWAARATDVAGAGGPDVALHLRGRTTPVRVLLDLATALLPAVNDAGALLIVNDRADVALVVGADGIHLGRRALPPAAARTVLGPEPWMGVSCHNGEEVEAAAAEGADYAFVGTIYPTASHPGADGMGVAGLAETVAGAGHLPVVGIGGIGPVHVGALVAAGAYGVAAIRGVWNAGDPAEAVRQYLEGFGD